MKMIMVVPKSAWGKEDHEVEEIIRKEREEEEKRRLEEEKTKEASTSAVQTINRVKSLKETALFLLEKKMSLLPENCCFRFQNCRLLKCKCVQQALEVAVNKTK